MGICNVCGGAIFAANEVTGYGGAICRGLHQVTTATTADLDIPTKVHKNAPTPNSPSESTELKNVVCGEVKITQQEQTLGAVTHE